MGPIIEAPIIIGEALWIALQVLLVFFLVLLLVRLFSTRVGERSWARRHLPEDALLQRYAQGELSRQQYLRALVDIRKDRSIWDSPNGYETPLNLIRLRYAQGEIGREQYLDALVDILKERYVRGELEVEEYEERLDHLLQDQPRRRRDVV